MKKVLFIFMAFAFLIFFSPSAKAAGHDQTLVVNEPKDNLMTTASSVVVSGEALPSSGISVIVNGKTKASFSIGAAGIFLTQVPINEKENIITVKAVFPSGTVKTASRRVYRVEKGEKWPELDSLIQTIKTFLILK